MDPMNLIAAAVFGAFGAAWVARRRVDAKKARYFYVNLPGSADPAQIKKFSDLNNLNAAQIWVPGMRAEPGVLYRYEGTEAELNPGIQLYGNRNVYVQEPS